MKRFNIRLRTTMTNTRIRLLLFLIIMLAGTPGNSKEMNSYGADKISLLAAIEKISQEYEVYFTFDMTLVSDVTVEYDDWTYTSAEEAISHILEGTDLNYKFYDQRFVILYRSDAEGIESLKKMSEHLDGLINEGEQNINSSPRTMVRAIPKLPGRIPAKSINRITFSVEGKVVDQEGEPLIGVNIQVKGSNKGTATDFDGNFILEDIDENAVLVISYVGYQTQEIPISGQSNIEIVMTSDSQLLDEVVVVGYGTQKKVNLTGAVSSVASKDLETSIDANIASRLQGHVPGVSVTRDNSPGGDVSLRIRGFGSINNNNPLYVIDGVPTTGGLNLINADDIESISILKDAAAAAIYGSRSSNGVIIITTKKGKVGKPKISLSSRYGIQQTSSRLNLLNTKEYGELIWLEKRNAGLKPGDNGWGHQQYGYGAEPVIPDYIYPAGKMQGEVDESTYNYPDPYNGITRANKEGTNWYNEIFDRAPINETNLSINGGTDKSSYLFSLGYLNQDGVLKHTGYKRYSMRANSNMNITEWLKAGINIGISNSIRNGASYNTEGGPIAQAYRAQPIIPVYDINGNFAGTKAPTTGNASNPVAELYRAKDNNADNTRILASAYAEIQLIPELRLRSLIGIDHNKNHSKNYLLKNVEMSEAREVDAMSEAFSGGLQYNWSNTINYEQKYKDVHDVSIMAGSEIVQYGWNSFGAGRSTFAFNDIDYMILNSGETSQTATGSFDGWSTLSYFSRLNYIFRDKYILEGVVRRDGSSRFSKENRWGTFPSISAGWVVSQEEFMHDISWFNELKIRGGWGLNGNDNVGNYNIYSTFRAAGSESYYNISGSGNNASQAGFHKFKLGNEDAKWESTESKNLGVDISIFNYKLMLSIDIYSKLTKNMLYPDSKPATWGFLALPSINVGSMENKGIDFSIGYRNNYGNFDYNIQVNLSHYDNKILSLNENSNEILFGDDIRNSIFTASKSGFPISSFYGYHVEGIFNTYEEIDKWPKYNPDSEGNDSYSIPGVLMFRDINGDGKITPDDRDFIGNPHPKLTYGLNMGLQYKNIDIITFFNGVYGNDVINYGKRVTDFNHFSNNRSPERLYESWTEERYINGDKISLPMALTDDRDVVMQMPSSFFIEKGSYFRLKNLQIGYRFHDLFSNTEPKSLRLYFQATNLLTITNYSGLDPEFRSVSDRQMGLDIGIYPSAQTFMFGMNLDF